MRFCSTRCWSHLSRSISCMHQHTSQTSAYVSIRRTRQHTSAYVSIRQHTSAHVSTRPHTSYMYDVRLVYFVTNIFTAAYVSIRQHTSAYVSICAYIYVCKTSIYCYQYIYVCRTRIQCYQYILIYTHILKKVHWFAILNSFIMVLFLLGLVALILLRTLKVYADVC